MNKKILSLFAFIGLLFFCGSFLNAESNITFIKSYSTEYKKTLPITEYNWQNVNGTISYEEFIEELEEFKYLLTTSYIGYEKMLMQGFDINVFENNVKAEFEKSVSVDSKKLQSSLYENIKKFVQDAHFFINFFMTEKVACNFENVYYSDLYVKKVGDKYFYIKDNKIKEEYKESEDNLFCYPSKGSDVYRIGIFSNEQPKFDGYKLDTAIAPATSLRFNSKQTSKTVYYSLSSFMLPAEGDGKRKASEIMLERLKKSVQNNYDKENIIVDLRGNLGGIQGISMDLVNLLLGIDYSNKENNVEKDIYYMNYLISPSIALATYNWDKSLGNFSKKYVKGDKKNLDDFTKNPRCELYKNYFFSKNYNEGFPIKNKYQNKIYVIFDRNTSSAAELFYGYLVSVIDEPSRVKLVGENSAGRIENGSVWSYLLPYSHICVVLPSRSFSPTLDRISSWHGEGKGFFPDYWCTGEDLLETLIAVTHDEELRTVLSNIYYGLQ